MKEGIHPQYYQATVTCNCGNTFVTGSTRNTAWKAISFSINKISKRLRCISQPFMVYAHIVQRK